MTREARNVEPKSSHPSWERVFNDDLSPARIEALRTAGFQMNWVDYADQEAPELIGFRVLEKSDDTCDAAPLAIIWVDRTSGLSAEVINAANADAEINRGYRIYLHDDNPNPTRWAAQLAVLDELLDTNL